MWCRCGSVRRVKHADGIPAQARQYERGTMSRWSHTSASLVIRKLKIS